MEKENKPDGNGWNEYEMYVMKELVRLGKTQCTILEAINTLKTDMAVEKDRLKWVTGGISAFVSLIFTTAVLFIKHLVRG